MKKIIILLMLFVFIMTACSVQEKMSPEIFFERLSGKSDEYLFDDKELFYEDIKCVCFIKDIYGSELVYEFALNDKKDIYKISFACNEADKAEKIIVYIKDIITVYAPQENADEVVRSLTENGKPDKGFSYYETQWYSWAVYSDENGVFFSVTNNKVVEKTTAEYSLKPNDKSGF